mgnify:CR=1 FL=1
MKTKKQPVYLYQCISCKKNVYTEDTTLVHCEKLTQHIRGIEGKGIDMVSPMVKVAVSGYVKMSQESLDKLLAQADPHTALTYSLHMGHVDSGELSYELEEEEEE